MITKRWTKKHKITSLQPEQGFNLQTIALDKLNSNYSCCCKSSNTPREHFPKLVQFDSTSNTVVMSNCGTDLSRVGTRESIFSSLTNQEILEQVRCIVINLTRAGIKHLDCPPNGQNVCWDPSTKTISLIDFDACFVDGYRVKNRVLSKWNKDYGSGEEYEAKFTFQLLFTILGGKESISKKVRELLLAEH